MGSKLSEFVLEMCPVHGHKRLARWRGGLVVGRRTCDLVVAGSSPGRDDAA